MHKALTRYSAVEKNRNLSKALKLMIFAEEHVQEIRKIGVIAVM